MMQAAREVVRRNEEGVIHQIYRATCFLMELKLLVYSAFSFVHFLPKVFVTESILVMETAGHTKGWLQRSPYGTKISLTKLECLGHIQKKKRMEARLRRMVKENTGTKFHDVRPLRGRGHFTKCETYKLQNYYSLAIRRNVHNLEALKGPVWAIFFYKLSINGKPPT